MSGGIYRQVRDQIANIFNANWMHPEVQVYWRENIPDPLPSPQDGEHFLMLEVDPGRESIMAFGAGRFENERALFGSLRIYVFSARSLRSEDVTLDLLAESVAIFRSLREGNLSFIGDGSSFSEGATDDGGWYMRGSLVVFEYRFVG